MPVFVIDDLAAETTLALEERAGRNGRTVAAEARAIIDAAVQIPQSGSKLVSDLHALGRQLGIPEDFEIVRDTTRAGSVSFE